MNDINYQAVFDCFVTLAFLSISFAIYDIEKKLKILFELYKRQKRSGGAGNNEV